MKVAVYWNFHKKIFSIQSRDKETYGLVVSHLKSAVVALPKFVIRQAGREKVLKEKKKNVHAYIVGHLIKDVPMSFTNWDEEKGYNSRARLISYNPYKDTTFVTVDTKEEVSSAAMARLWIHGQRPVMETFQ